MEIKRTANAGCLLTLDGSKILMDGVCREVKPYPATPPDIRDALLRQLPEGVLVTHRHKDHYDASFVSAYVQNAAGPVLGPADIPFCTRETTRIGNVEIRCVPSRHIGRTEPMDHMSFVLRGSKCVWFLGDASPLLWKHRADLPMPDVMIVPYAYAIGSGWEICKQLGAQDVVLLHLPPWEEDPFGLWKAVEDTVTEAFPRLHIPEMGDTVSIG